MSNYNNNDDEYIHKTANEILNFLNSKNSENLVRKTNKYYTFTQIAREMYNDELSEIDDEIDEPLKNLGTIKIVPTLHIDKYSDNIKIDFKIGNKRLYKLRDLSQFYINMMNKEKFRYGQQLEFVHTKEMFDEDSQKALEFIMKNAEIITFTNSSSNTSYRYYGNVLSTSSIIITNTALDDLFDVYDGKTIDLDYEMSLEKLKFLNQDPDLSFSFKKTKNKDEYVIETNFKNHDIFIFRGKKFKYVLYNFTLYRCSKEFEKTNLKLISLFKDNYIDKVLLSKDELGELFSVVLPQTKDAIKIDDKIREEVSKYRPENLGVKVYLDFDENNNLTANIKYCYGENEFNPLDDNEISKINFSRNMPYEMKVAKIFRNTGFMFDKENLRLILPDDELIYKFLTDDVNLYMKKFEVLASESFKNKEIVKPKISSLGVRTENNLLEVDLNKLNIELSELEEAMKKYKLKKKYFRLKDGSFLDLQNNQDMDFIDKLMSGSNVTYKDLEDGIVRMPVNRSLYLNQLLKGMHSTEIIKDKEYKNIVNDLNKELLDEDILIPKEMENVLRPYQKVGFKWLKTLERYKFGGILADDMGLGKTIQVISMFLDYKENSKEHRTSIVISPSSLSLNWKNEIERFAPDLKIMVVRGTAFERSEIIDKLEDYDVIITSYDLLKRDIEKYVEKKYCFQYVIADEAQYLKNNNTKNAKSIKLLNSNIRFALTGTPIENSLAELWSIFDFVMPGYLFGYKEFKNRFESPIVKEQDEKAMNKLRMLIEPFVLRRTKKQVLTELPEKTVTVLSNEMDEEQKNIYLSYLLSAKRELQQEFDRVGFEKSQMQILAALTRLRQICCHPSLFISNYQGRSSKLDQCMEIIEEGVNAGHKILLFSSYTSMFDIIEKSLKEDEINYFKLTGSTKVDERIELVDEFNQNPDIGVFLISLKAGGTGLNLIGADMVIHYDPWWNLSAENQATDRAYRIGQKNNVQVYKLITKDSIEEKIYEMQQKKAELTDNVLSTNATFISKLSKDEIMNLFS